MNDQAGGNLYTTTIYALASSVAKIAQAGQNCHQIGWGRVGMEEDPRAAALNREAGRCTASGRKRKGGGGRGAGVGRRGGGGLSLTARPAA